MEVRARLDDAAGILGEQAVEQPSEVAAGEDEDGVAAASATARQRQANRHDSNSVEL